MKFLDREDAGKRLAAELLSYKSQMPLVLAIPRGGVPVGYEVARVLRAPLDVIIARKIGCPKAPELGVGAIVEGGSLYLNQYLIESLNISEAELQEIIKRESQKVKERVALFRGGQPLPQIEGRTVILVDDGIATGGTVRAALCVLKQSKPNRIILAAPVAAKESIEELRSEVNEVVYLLAPSNLISVGLWYRDFTQVSDDKVVSILKQRRDEQSATTHQIKFK